MVALSKARQWSSSVSFAAKETLECLCLRFFTRETLECMCSFYIPLQESNVIRGPKETLECLSLHIERLFCGKRDTLETLNMSSLVTYQHISYISTHKRGKRDTRSRSLFTEMWQKRHLRRRTLDMSSLCTYQHILYVSTHIGCLSLHIKRLFCGKRDTLETRNMSSLFTYQHISYISSVSFAAKETL